MGRSFVGNFSAVGRMFDRLLEQKQASRVLGLIVSLIVVFQAHTITVVAVSFCSVSGFAPPEIQNPPNFTSASVATGDFNGDGRPDIVVGASAGGGIAVALNDGSGSFGVATIYPVFAVFTDITTGDFNNDGKLDIAGANQDTIGSVVVLLGTGTGSFGSPIVSLSGGPSAKYLATGNFNGDGNLDVAVSNAPINGTGNIAILLGNGMGSFTLSSVTALQSQFMRSTDFNRDGKMDVLGIGFPLRLYFGDGTGGLSAPQTIGASTILNFTIADFDHDNNPDIAGMNVPNTVLNVSVLLGNGNGTFSPEVVYPVGGNTASFIENGDVNGDGHLDIVVTRPDPNPGVAGKVFVILGTGAGTFGPKITYSLSAQQQPNKLALADFHGDGRADIVTSNLFNLSRGFLVLLSTCLIPTPRYDFDGDGKSDVSVFRPQTGFWYMLPSSTNSYRFQEWGTSTDRVVPGDYDGDSKTDLAVYRPSSGTWFILRSTNNTFIAQAFGTSTDDLVPADYDADGRTDLAIYRAGTWYIQRSSDNAVISQSFGTASDKPMPADYDGDGKADIAVYRPADGMWYIQQSTNNSFRAQPFGASTDVPLSGDFDGDGKADVAVYRPASGTWYALKSSDSSLLASRWGVDTDIPVTADYDGDGKTDLAVFRPLDGTWYISRSSDGSFATQQFGLASDVPVPASY